MIVKEIMTKEVITLSPNDSLVKAAKVLVENNIGAAPVVDEDEKVVGIIAESDLVNVMQYKDDLGSSLLMLVPGYGERWSFQKSFEDTEKWLKHVEEGKVKEEMSENPYTLKPEDPVSKVSELFVVKNVNQAPVVIEDDQLVGIVSRADLVKAMKEV